MNIRFIKRKKSISLPERGAPYAAVTFNINDEETKERYDLEFLDQLLWDNGRSISRVTFIAVTGEKFWVWFQNDKGVSYYTGFSFTKEMTSGAKIIDGYVYPPELISRLMENLSPEEKKELFQLKKGKKLLQTLAFQNDASFLSKDDNSDLESAFQVCFSHEPAAFELAINNWLAKFSEESVAEEYKEKLQAQENIFTEILANLHAILERTNNEISLLKEKVEQDASGIARIQNQELRKILNKQSTELLDVLTSQKASLEDECLFIKAKIESIRDSKQVKKEDDDREQQLNDQTEILTFLINFFLCLRADQCNYEYYSRVLKKLGSLVFDLSEDIFAKDDEQRFIIPLLFFILGGSKDDDVLKKACYLELLNSLERPYKFSLSEFANREPKAFICFFNSLFAEENIFQTILQQAIDQNNPHAMLEFAKLNLYVAHAYQKNKWYQLTYLHKQKAKAILIELAKANNSDGIALLEKYFGNDFQICVQLAEYFFKHDIEQAKTYLDKAADIFEDQRNINNNNNFPTDAIILFTSLRFILSRLSRQKQRALTILHQHAGFDADATTIITDKCEESAKYKLQTAQFVLDNDMPIAGFDALQAMIDLLNHSDESIQKSALEYLEAMQNKDLIPAVKYTITKALAQFYLKRNDYPKAAPLFISAYTHSQNIEDMFPHFHDQAFRKFLDEETIVLILSKATNLGNMPYHPVDDLIERKNDEINFALLNSSLTLHIRFYILNMLLNELIARHPNKDYASIIANIIITKGERYFKIYQVERYITWLSNHESVFLSLIRNPVTMQTLSEVCPSFMEDKVVQNFIKKHMTSSTHPFLGFFQKKGRTLENFKMQLEISYSKCKNEVFQVLFELSEKDAMAKNLFDRLNDVHTLKDLSDFIKDPDFTSCLSAHQKDAKVFFEMMQLPFREISLRA